MNTKITISAILFLVSLVSGFGLYQSGRPYGVGILTLHKLISLAAMVLLGLDLYRHHQAAPMGGLSLGLLIVAGLSFLVLIATGGMLSAVKEFQLVVLHLHQIAPWLALLSSGVLVTLPGK